MKILSKYILYVCLYIYKINIHSTHVYCVNSNFILDVINLDYSFDNTNIYIYKHTHACIYLIKFLRLCIN